jgi:hypothetical protein
VLLDVDVETGALVTVLSETVVVTAGAVDDAIVAPALDTAGGGTGDAAATLVAVTLTRELTQAAGSTVVVATASGLGAGVTVVTGVA